MYSQDFGERLLDRHSGIETSEGILKHNADWSAPPLRQRLTIKRDRAGAHGCQSNNSSRQRRLSAPTFANERHDLRLRQRTAKHCGRRQRTRRHASSVPIRLEFLTCSRRPPFSVALVKVADARREVTRRDRSQQPRRRHARRNSELTPSGERTTITRLPKPVAGSRGSAQEDPRRFVGRERERAAPRCRDDGGVEQSPSLTRPPILVPRTSQ